VTLDARRQRLWEAMGLGPVWQSRSAAHPAPEGPMVDLRADHAAPEGRAMDLRAGLAAPGGRASDPRVARIAQLDWDALATEVAACRACPLGERRTQAVFGVGYRHAEWMLVGEAPGAEEDARGEPFVGQAGRLLDNMLASIGLSRLGETPQSVFIANVLKCRPPGNRNPEPAEVAQCEPFLRRQVELVDPRVLIVMGRFAAQALLGTDASIASLRGHVHHIDVGERRVPVVVTYHPAYLLRNLEDKAKSWADLCFAREVHARAARSG
jgi:uracil-DNA glycosylase family 4